MPASKSVSAAGASVSLRGSPVAGGRPGETTLLKVLGEHPDPGAVPVQELDPVARLVREDKEGAALRVELEVLGRERPQAVVLRAHVHRLLG